MRFFKVTSLMRRGENRWLGVLDRMQEEPTLNARDKGRRKKEETEPKGVYLASKLRVLP